MTVANTCNLASVTLPVNAIKVANSIVNTPVGAIPAGVFTCDTANNYAGTLTATCTEASGTYTASVTGTCTQSEWGGGRVLRMVGCLDGSPNPWHVSHASRCPPTVSHQ